MKTEIARVYVEHCKAKDSTDFPINRAKDWFSGGTAFYGVGWWGGISEDSVCIELHDANREKVLDFAQLLKADFGQECIRVLFFDAEIVDV